MENTMLIINVENRNVNTYLCSWNGILSCNYKLSLVFSPWVLYCQSPGLFTHAGENFFLISPVKVGEVASSLASQMSSPLSSLLFFLFYPLFEGVGVFHHSLDPLFLFSFFPRFLSPDEVEKIFLQIELASSSLNEGFWQ